jgi:hypothetical protein
VNARVVGWSVFFFYFFLFLPPPRFLCMLMVMYPCRPLFTGLRPQWYKLTNKDARSDNTFDLDVIQIGESFYHEDSLW